MRADTMKIEHSVLDLPSLMSIDAKASADKVTFDVLAFSSENCRQLLEAIPCALLMVDNQGRILLVNKQLETMFAYHRMEMLGQKFEMLMPSHFRGMHAPLFSAYLAHPQTRAMGAGRDLMGVRKDGVEISIEVGLNTFTMEYGPIVLVSIVDITARKHAEALLRHKNNELKTFAYTVSHDLKTPLRGITGYAQELERSYMDSMPDRAKFCIAQLLTASGNLNQLIEDLLKYSRVESEQAMFSSVNLIQVVARILSDRSYTLNELAVEVSVNVPTMPLMTWEHGLNQILVNLVDNALKYSSGSLPPKLAIVAVMEEGVCKISVSDNGIGFDMQYLERIFGLFNRLVRPNEFEGTGVGLAIVKKLVEKLNGCITAESTPSLGARFIVEFPIKYTTE